MTLTTLIWMLADLPIVLAVVSYALTSKFGVFFVVAGLMILSTTYLGNALLGLPVYVGLAAGAVSRLKRERNGWM